MSLANQEPPQVIGYATREKFGKQKKFEDNAWFVGYAPRRNPEIVVAVLVQESGKHGGEEAGPVVKEVIKAYYDKKNKKTQGEVTAENKKTDSRNRHSSRGCRCPRHGSVEADVEAGRKRSRIVPARATAEPQR